MTSDKCRWTLIEHVANQFKGTKVPKVWSLGDEYVTFDNGPQVTPGAVSNALGKEVHSFYGTAP